MKIAMIGTGYVGLVSGVCLSDFGHDVVCVDRDPEKIAALQNGKVPIYEPGLEDVMARNMSEGRLRFTNSLYDAMDGANVVFIAVGTPMRRGNGHADIDHVLTAAHEISAALEKSMVVVVKSTVPVGVTLQVESLISELCPETPFCVASNPEFLREGSAVEDFMKPDRVVIGAESDLARDALYEVYRPLYLRDFPILFTDIKSAELTKYASNAFLATKISFINEMAALCEEVGADVKSVAQGMGLDARIGNKFLHAGPGYGGSCFPKDTAALARIGQDNGVAQRITEAAMDVNERTQRRMVDKIEHSCAGSVNGKTIAVLGVTFKPNTDDMRDAPSLTIVPALIGKGADVRVVDPQGRREGEELLPGASWISDPYVAADQADCVVILTEWNQFRALSLDDLHRRMRTPVMVDLRNIYDPGDASSAGFRHVGVGR